MPVILRINFDRPYGAYFAGETVTGQVDVQVDKPTKVQAVTITFRGEAEVMWTETETETRHRTGHVQRTRPGTTITTRTRTHAVTHSASEIYFSNKAYFVGGDSDDITLAPGDYKYPFQCLLPHALPSSFEGAHGHVRYTAKARVHRPWKFDHTARAAFNVVSPLDLNMFPQAKVPIEREQSKHFCCLWCKSGPLTMSVRVPNGGYVPGQTILLQIQVDNASTTEVRNLRGTLNQVVRWQATTKTKTTEKRMADLVFDSEVKAHDSRVFSQMITVPPVPPSHLNNCRIIDLEYLLTVTARVGGAHLNLEVKAPILIGTFPLMEASDPPAYPYPSPSAPPGTPSPTFRSPQAPRRSLTPASASAILPIPKRLSKSAQQADPPGLSDATHSLARHHVHRLRRRRRPGPARVLVLRGGDSHRARVSARGQAHHDQIRQNRLLGEAMVRRQRRFILTADLILNLVKPRERKEYLSSKSYLLGGDSGEEKLLGPGDHEFHFQCALPHRLPSSFAGKYGHIRYTAKASVRRAEGGVQRASVVFTVVEPLDLNTLPQATVAAPIDKKDSKHFWCLGCSSGPLSMSLRAPRGGYVPGQTIPFDVEVCNEAGTHAVRSVSVRLIQLVFWTANCQRLLSYDVLDEVVFDDSRVEGNESKAFSREFTVRPVPPALSKDKCDLLNWKYMLQATAKVGGPHINLRVSTPIVIGTTPLAALK